MFMVDNIYHPQDDQTRGGGLKKKHPEIHGRSWIGLVERTGMVGRKSYSKDDLWHCSQELQNAAYGKNPCGFLSKACDRDVKSSARHCQVSEDRQFKELGLSFLENRVYQCHTNGQQRQRTVDTIL